MTVIIIVLVKIISLRKCFFNHNAYLNTNDNLVIWRGKIVLSIIHLVIYFKQRDISVSKRGFYDSRVISYVKSLV